jgi:Zn-dependent protease
MSTTARLGTIRGIEIGINWSWLVIAVLLTWSLAAGVFPETNPGLSDRAYVAMAAIAVPVFFACLLAHELGHALQAKREDMRIEGITLWALGGVARFSGRFPSPGAELRIALAGPAVSLVLGAALLGVALAVPLPSGVDGTVHWLGYINLTLLAFNLLPALPLDGGRVLQAVLWARKGDLDAATGTAAAIGAGFGQLMIVGGVLLAVAGGGIGGLWLALIGWFLVGAASAEASLTHAQTALAGISVADLMVADPVTVEADRSLASFVDDVLLRARHTAYPVLRHGEPVGLVSFRVPPLPPRATWTTTTVADRTAPLGDCLVVGPGDPVADVAAELFARQDRRALVLDRGRLAGLLTAADVARVLELPAPARSRT